MCIRMKRNRGWVRTGQFSWSGAPGPPASDLSTRLNVKKRQFGINERDIGRDFLRLEAADPGTQLRKKRAATMFQRLWDGQGCLIRATSHMLWPETPASRSIEGKSVPSHSEGFNSAPL